MNTGFPLRVDRIWFVVGAVAVVVLVVGGASLAVRGVPERAPTGAAMTDPAPSTAPRNSSARPTEDAPAPDTGLVRIAAGAAEHPSAAAVRQLLDRHFSAINDGDYDRWATTVVPRRAADQPRTSWRQAYRSTIDESIVVNGITTTSGQLAVELTFTSRQNPADAPADLRVGRICWSSTWPVTTTSGGLLIGTPAEGATSKRSC
jgi:hypothetical protein